MDVGTLVTKLELETKNFDKGIKASIKEIGRFEKSVKQMRGVIKGLEKTQTGASKKQHDMMKALITLTQSQLQEARKLAAAISNQTRETGRLNNAQKQTVSLAKEEIGLARNKLSQISAQIKAEEQLVKAKGKHANVLDTLKKKNDKVTKSQGELNGSSETYLTKLLKISQVSGLAGSAFTGFRSLVQSTVSDFIDAAREAENYRVKLETVFGSSKKGAAAFDEMAAFASKVPFSFQEIMGAATNISPILQQNNESLKEWMPIMGDLAAVSGLTLEEVSTNMMKLMSAGTAGSDLFREKGINSILGLLPGISYSGKESIEIIKKAAHSSTSIFTGLTKRLSYTWDGQITSLKNKWFVFRQELMDSELFDFLKAGLYQLNSYFEKNDGMKSFAQSMGSAITKALKTVLKAFLVFKYSFDDFIAKNKGYLEYFLKNPRMTILFGVKNQDKIDKEREDRINNKGGLNKKDRSHKKSNRNWKGGRNKSAPTPSPAKPKVAKKAPKDEENLTPEERADKKIAEIEEIQNGSEFQLDLIPGLSDEASKNVSNLTSEIDKLKKAQTEGGSEGVAAIQARISAMQSELGLTVKSYEAAKELASLRKKQSLKVVELEAKAPPKGNFKSDEAFNTAKTAFDEKRQLLFAQNKAAAENLAGNYKLNLQQLVDQSAKAEALKVLGVLEKNKFVQQETLKIKKMIASAESKQTQDSMTPYQQKVEQVRLDHERIAKSLGGEYKGDLEKSLDKWKATSLETLKINRNLEQARKNRALLDQQGAVGLTGVKLEKYNLETEYNNAVKDAGTDEGAIAHLTKNHAIKLETLNKKIKQSWKETMDALSMENQRFGASEFSAPVYSYFDKVKAKTKELGEGNNGELGEYKKQLLNLSGKQMQSAASGAGTVGAWMARGDIETASNQERDAEIKTLNAKGYDKRDATYQNEYNAIVDGADEMSGSLEDSFDMGMISGGLETQLMSMSGAFSDFFMTVQETGKFAFGELIGSLMRQLQVQAASMLSQFLMRAAFHGIMQFVDDSPTTNHAGKAVAALQGAAVMGSFVAGSTLAGMAHDGIDEVPGLNGKNEGTWLLEKGERVVDKRTNADLKNYLSDGGGNGGGGTNVNITINEPKDKDSVLEAMPQLRQMIIDTVGSNIASNGSINKSIKAYT